MSTQDQDKLAFIKAFIPREEMINGTLERGLYPREELDEMTDDELAVIVADTTKKEMIADGLITEEEFDEVTNAELEDAKEMRETLQAMQMLGALVEAMEAVDAEREGREPRKIGNGETADPAFDAALRDLGL